MRPWIKATKTPRSICQIPGMFFEDVMRRGGPQLENWKEEKKTKIAIFHGQGSVRMRCTYMTMKAGPDVRIYRHNSSWDRSPLAEAGVARWDIQHSEFCLFLFFGSLYFEFPNRKLFLWFVQVRNDSLRYVTAGCRRACGLLYIK